MNKFKFEAGIKALSVSFCSGLSDEEMQDVLKVYYKTLCDEKMNDDIFNETVQKLIRTWTPEFGKKFPTIKDLLNTAGLSVESISEKAHGAIRKAIMAVGAYEPLSLGKEHRHAVAHETIRRMGGWPTVCQNGIQEWDRNKERFLRIYSELYFQKVENKHLLCLSDNKNIEYSKQLVSKNI